MSGLEIVRAEHLGPCDTCGLIVRAGTECSECLENAGSARHERCCDLPFGGLR